ncbi:MAG: helix-turn-helix domain-containing protein [Spirochaetes bacterium]|nr:helix-turn-helix domain-containing protein [Spirochaetota bacterium]
MEINNLSADMSDLKDITGDEIFLKICRHFEGTSIYFSKGITRDIQKQLILADYDKGMSYKDLAKKYNYSEVWIREVCNNLFKREDKLLFPELY